MGNRRQKIMLVDDNMANLTIGKNMLKDAYEVYAVPSAAKLFEILEHVTPDLILLDVMMPEMDGYEAIRRLKADRRRADIPVIFLTSKIDERSELEGLSLGAIDYVAKPFSAPLLLKRIENQLLIVSQRLELKNYNDNLQAMVHRKTEQIIELQNAVLSTVAEMVEFRDNLTGGHVTRTQMYLELLVNTLLAEKIYEEEVSSWDLDFLIPSAQLHDVGKIAISDAILNKPGKLDPGEFEEMKKHVTIGVEAIDRIAKKTRGHSFLLHARVIAGAHHEKWDGSGYPAGLREKEIPLEGRLMAIADVYDALISKRPYKQPISAKEAEKIIEAGRGAHFDPLLIDGFRLVAEHFAVLAEQYC
ncbi:MAG: response regulator [Candidatus Adiutrix sp.]|jgi:putative two-component system response regulator|nr:response regulator [Candidatus Adiutrix sp.]